jgi:hypothetical protein
MSILNGRRWLAPLLAFLSLLSAISLPAQSSAEKPAAPLPLKYTGPATVPDITPGDLMTRVYIFADDSLMGRRVGTIYNDKGTDYIARELARFGLTPAGDNGTFFQKLPLVNRMLDSSSTIAVEGTTFRAFADFIATSPGRIRDVAGLPGVYLGVALDTVNIPPADSLRGKIAVLRAGFLPPGTNVQQFVQSNGFRAYQAALEAPTAIVVIGGEQLSPTAVRSAANPSGIMRLVQGDVPVSINVTSKVGEALLGMPPASATKGAAVKPFTLDIRFRETEKPGRNVVAVLPGSDPRLRGQYVAIGAHNDHVGWSNNVAEHDSVKAFKQIVQPQGADSPNRPATADEALRIRAITDSLRQVYPPRPDSIYNGADDDASGSMTVLEIAEAFARGREKPRRSLLFVWHTGEEAGLWGADHFTANPTVPRDSIVGQLNMDMVGRGGASDITGENKEGGLLRGGEGYVQLIGSRRLSTELGDLIETVNTEKQLGLRFDYAMDANGHPQNIYCRSDHYEYAKYGVPIVFFTTGGHSDYHQVTDEPQYLDYGRMAQVARLVHASALQIGNLDHRLTVDKPKPDPKGQCVQ